MRNGFYDCTPASSDPLYQICASIRDYLLDLLSWIRNVLNDVWDYFAQARLIAPHTIHRLAEHVSYRLEAKQFICGGAGQAC